MDELQLLDITTPNELPWYSFSFFTWSILILILIAGLSFAYWHYVLRKKTKKYILFNEINEEIKKIEHLIEMDLISHHHLAQNMETLLKRLALSFFEEGKIRKLKSNREWLIYLNQQVSKHPMNQTSQSILLEATYQPKLQFDKTEFVTDIKNYLDDLKKNV